ncbi:hypothetical protein [Streptomyces sp. NPDC057718]|uniref:hypothetical protein n=1 Tax=Streptomyces sp. NPDC057718 TaxID=3346225 RepID=UPI0036B93F8F
MSLDDRGDLPHTGLEIAQTWGKLPAEHLKVALQALEPQLAREHAVQLAKEELASERERRIRQEAANRERELILAREDAVRNHELRMAEVHASHELEFQRARWEIEEAQAGRAHMLYFAGLIAGFVVTIATLTGAVVVGVAGQAWLSAMLCGPSVLALATLFVLRRNDPAQTQAAARSHRSALGAASQPPPNAVDPGVGGATGGVV